MHRLHAAMSSSVSPPIKQPEGAAEIAGAGLRHHVLGDAARHDASLVEHEQIVVGLDLVEQMRCPQHADIVGAGKLMDVPHDGAARRHVEADGRLVEQQQLRAVQ